MISTGASPPAAAELAARAAASPTASTGVAPASEAPDPTPLAVRPSPQADRFDPIRLRENLAEAIEQINKQLADSGRNLGISMDQVLNRPVVKVVNTQTGELVRQIPSEAVVKVAHTLEALKGLLYDATT